MTTVVVAGGCAAGGNAAHRQRDLNQQLILAAYQGRADEVHRLLAAGAWGDAWFAGTDEALNRAFGVNGGYAPIGAERWTALHAAAEAPGDIDRVRVARVLLDTGAHPDAVDSHGATPLYMAVSENHEALALWLIDRGAAVNSFTDIYIDGNEGTPLHRAIAHKNVRLVRALLAAGANVNTPDNWDYPPLVRAAGGRCVECVRLLIEAGADVNAGGGIDGNITPLIAACGAFSSYDAGRKGETNVEMARLLLAAGADVNARAEVKDFFDANNVTTETPLLEAANGQDFATMELLIEAGADVKVADHEGYTPLHHILSNTYQADDLRLVEAMVKVLLEAGADRAAKSKAGKTPLDVAPTVFEDDAPERARQNNRLRTLLTPAATPTPVKLK